MNKFKKFIAFACACLGILVMASCSSSGIHGIMEATCATNTIIWNITFDSNDKLKESAPFVKQYTISTDDSGKETYSIDTREDVEFKEGTYESATAKFEGLAANTKYKYELCVTYNDTQEVIYTDFATTTDNGDKDHPIEISTKDDFIAMKDNPSAYYVLKNNISFAGEDGKNTTLTSMFTSSNKFTGQLDGAGYTISGITLTATTYSGIFGYTSGAVIKNLNVENVDGSFSSSNTGIGALIGYATNTLVYNVKVSNVALTFSASSSSTDYSLGGVAGIFDASTAFNVEATNITLNVTQARGKVSTGLLFGKATGEPNKLDNYSTTIPATEIGTIGAESVLAYKSIATGSLSTYMYYTSGEGFTYIGGLIGNDGAAGLVKDCVADSNLLVTRYVTTSTSTSVNNFTLAVGGLIGGNNSGNGINVDGCAAIADINVYSGEEITKTGDERAALVEAQNANQYSRKTVNVGGIIGVVNSYAGLITNSAYIKKTTDADGSGINVYAALYAKTSDTADITVSASNYKKYFVNDNDTFVTPTADYSSEVTYYYQAKFVSETVAKKLEAADVVSNLKSFTTKSLAAADTIFAAGTTVMGYLAPTAA